MPLINSGDLFQLITILKIQDERLSDEHAKHIFVQILRGLSFMHEGQRVAHRDVKPHNVMMDTYDEVLLADFGTSKKMEARQMEETFDLDEHNQDYTQTAFVGTITYMAPEIV